MPYGNAGMWIAGGLTTFWVALGSIVATFPGVLERVFGISYDFKGTWGVSRATFEVLTLGTLAVVFALALTGYALGRGVRENVATVPIETEATAPAAVV